MAATRLSPLAQQVMGHPEWLEQEAAERSLHEFGQQMWRFIDPAPYLDNWHLQVICEHLEAVTRGEIKRLIINIPPRHSKSSLVAVMWPAWTWIKRKRDHGPLAGPQVKFMAASYAHSLSVRDSVKGRRLIESPVYQERWGGRFKLTSDQNTKIRFENDKGGYRLATSVGGALTGEGGDVIIVDDPINISDAASETVRRTTIDWWDESMSTRLNAPDAGAYVVIMQRVHDQDLTGHLLVKGGWTHLCLPARFEPDHIYPFAADPRTHDRELLWPERFSESAITQLERDLGSYGAAGQLQQRPSPRRGGMFDPDWWEYEPAAPKAGRAVRAWDLAASTEIGASWTAGVLMRIHQDVYYVEDVVRIRDTPEKVERLIVSTAKRDGKEVTIDLPQDPGQAGKMQVRYYVRQLAGFNARYSPESGSKEQRAVAMSSQTEARNVKLVTGDWNAAFVAEAALFPNSDHSDQIDASSRAFHRLTQRRRTHGRTAPVLISSEV